MEKLALYGGEKAKKTPYGDANRFGKEELEHLKEAIEQKTLFYVMPDAKQVRKMTAKMEEIFGVEHCVATSSGTASIHVALGALGITAGDEVITTPITDMGSVIGILAQNAIPVFADVDPVNFNITAESIEKCITDKTKAVIVVHLAGIPCDMDAIMAVARKHKIKVIEDCCQAFGCKYKGKYVGTIGDIGCFSFNEFKHIVAGDGGALLLNGDDLYYEAHRFADKQYDRYGKTLRGRIRYLSPNYRMNELTAACVLGQLDKKDEILGRHTAIGDAYTAAFKDLPGISVYKMDKGSVGTYLWYMFRVDEKTLGVSREEFIEALSAEGVICKAGYISECVYMYDMFLNKSAYQQTHCPFECPYYGRDIKYGAGISPVAEEVLRSVCFTSVSRAFTDKDVEETIHAVKKVVNYFMSRKK